MDRRAWIYASATVDDPPSWLERGTPASFGFASLHTRDVHIRECRAEVVAGALVTEVSVLSPLKKPAEPCAQVGLFERKKPPPAAGPDRSAAGEVFYGDGRTITRHFGNAVLGVR